MNRFAEIKQYKHRMLQYTFFVFFFTFRESTHPFNKSKPKKFTDIKQVTKQFQIINYRFKLPCSLLNCQGSSPQCFGHCTGSAQGRSL